MPDLYSFNINPIDSLRERIEYTELKNGSQASQRLPSPGTFSSASTQPGIPTNAIG